MTTSTRIFISVCEASADVHAASLVRAARERGYTWDFYGLTGPKLRELGVETVFDFASHAAMLSGVLGLIRGGWRAIRAVEQAWDARRPDVVVLLDSPELHLKLARRAKKRGIPVVYYIAPQTWASRAYRNRQIARDIDRLACILPFEEEYFGRGIQGLRDSGIEGKRCRAEYVGHPLFEALQREKPISDTVEFLKARAAGRPVVAILPGSRRHVIAAMLPRQLEVVQRLRVTGTDVYAAISFVDEAARIQVRKLLTAAASANGSAASTDDADLGIDLIVADNASLLTAADLVLVASGTATLHVAHYRKPMIVMYDAGRLMRVLHAAIGRFILTTPHLSLVNILAGSRIVPEFMPFIRDTAPIAAVAKQLLVDSTWRELMIRQLDEVVAPLEQSRASERVCDIIDELLQTRVGTWEGGKVGT
jgi:lipid-A-disaccharide synthase